MWLAERTVRVRCSAGSLNAKWDEMSIARRAIAHEAASLAAMSCRCDGAGNPGPITLLSIVTGMK